MTESTLASKVKYSIVKRIKKYYHNDGTVYTSVYYGFIAVKNEFDFRELLTLTCKLCYKFQFFPLMVFLVCFFLIRRLLLV